MSACWSGVPLGRVFSFLLNASISQFSCVAAEERRVLYALWQHFPAHRIPCFEPKGSVERRQVSHGEWRSRITSSPLATLKGSDALLSNWWRVFSNLKRTLLDFYVLLSVHAVTTSILLFFFCLLCVSHHSQSCKLTCCPRHDKPTFSPAASYTGSSSEGEDDGDSRKRESPRDRYERGVANATSKGFKDFCVRRIGQHAFGRREIEIAEQGEGWESQQVPNDRENWK